MNRIKVVSNKLETDRQYFDITSKEFNNKNREAKRCISIIKWG